MRVYGCVGCVSLLLSVLEASKLFLPTNLEALNIDLRVFRGRRLLYTATTWAGYIGVLTAQRPGSYAAAVNFREANGDAGSTGGTTEALPVGLAVRLALERNETYGDFVEEM